MAHKVPTRGFQGFCHVAVRSLRRRLHWNRLRLELLSATTPILGRRDDAVGPVCVLFRSRRLDRLAPALPLAVARHCGNPGIGICRPGIEWSGNPGTSRSIGLTASQGTACDFYPIAI